MKKLKTLTEGYKEKISQSKDVALIENLKNEFGQKGLQAVDADKNLICYDVQSLYNYLNEHYMSTNTMTNEVTDMISLYDFLGYPAGSILGTEVWKASFQEKVTTGTRHVETSRYKGPIVLYPKQFLIKYFKNKR